MIATEAKALPQTKRVVIIGAGFAGSAAAKALGNSSFDVTVL